MKKLRILLVALGMFGVGLGTPNTPTFETRLLKENEVTSAEDTSAMEPTDTEKPIENTSVTEPTNDTEETTSTETDATEPAEPTEPTDIVDYVGEWVSEWLSPMTITSITAIVSLLGAVLYLINQLKKLAKNKALTTDDVCAKVTEALKTIGTETTNNAILDVVKPIEERVDKMTPILVDFSKILALSQENTPESRIAILDIIEHLGTIGKEITDNSKKVVETEVAVIEEKKEETNKKIDEVIEKVTDEGRY
jgi:hypothetical protein